MDQSLAIVYATIGENNIFYSIGPSKPNKTRHNCGKKYFVFLYFLRKNFVLKIPKAGDAN